jgi:hypothetical protein
MPWLPVRSQKTPGAERRDRAWTGLIVNALVLPGLGSLLCARRVGWAQLVLSLVGAGLVLLWFVWLVVTVATHLEWPPDGGPYLPEGVAGIVIAVFAWVWSIVTSRSAMREARVDGGTEAARSSR